MYACYRRAATQSRLRVVEMNAVLAFGRGPITTLKNFAHISLATGRTS